MIFSRLREQDFKDFVWNVAAIVLVDMNSQIIAVSRPFEMMFGYLHKELISKDLSVLMDEETGKKHSEYVKRLCNSQALTATPMTMQSNVRAYRKDGQEIRVTVIIQSAYMDDVLSGNRANEQVAMGIVSQVPDKHFLEASHALGQPTESTSNKIES